MTPSSPEHAALWRTAVDREVSVELAARISAGTDVSDLLHVLLAGIVGTLLWPALPHAEILGWTAAITLAAVARHLLRVRARASGQSTHMVLVATRVGVTLLALTWGIGLIAVGHSLPLELLGLLSIVVLGVVSGAMLALLADPPSFFIMLAGLITPLTLAFGINADTRANTLAAVLVALFGVSMAFYYRRSHGSLLQQIRIAQQLKRTTAEAQAARESAEQMVEIVESTTDFIGTTTPEGRIVYLNKAGRAMLGIGAEQDVTGWTYADIVPPRMTDVVAHDHLPATLRDHLWTGESVLQHRDGREIPISSVAIAHLDADKRPRAISVVGRDVTEQVAAREALLVARDAAERAVLAKSAFIANTSHEIRTPLNGILGMVALLLDTELTAEQRRSAELIASSGETLLNTINDVLDLSKFEAGEMQIEAIAFDLHHLVHSTARLLGSKAASKSIALVTDVAGDVPQRVIGDPHRLAQVLTNLIANAVKFTHTGEVVASARAETHAHNPGRVRLRFAVRDTGIGIPAEFLANIFDPFRQVDASTTRKYGGTGLGLSISHKLVRMMGGELLVSSTLHQGSEFHFTVEWERTREEGPASPAVAGAMQQVRALVVDNHALSRRIVADMLRWAGSTVVEADSVHSAIDTLRRAATDGTPITLVTCSVEMPVDDGFALARELTADDALRQTRLILLTAIGRSGDDQKCRELDVAAYMQRPVSRVELVETALAALAGNTQRRERRSQITRIQLDENQRRRRVLVAEDNPVSQEVAEALLVRRGHDVTVVANGRDAVDAVRDTGGFDVILMDLQMPVHDGVSAAREIREMGHSGEALPIFALSANISLEERARCMDAGMTGYLAKPFKPHELFAIVEGWSPRTTRATVNTSDEGSVDLAGFRAMLADAGIPDAGDRMINAFLEDTPPGVAAMRAAADAGDLVEMRATAHRLASSAGTIYARALARELREAETLAHASDLESARAAVRRAASEFDRVQKYLRSQVRPSGG